MNSKNLQKELKSLKRKRNECSEDLTNNENKISILETEIKDKNELLKIEKENTKKIIQEEAKYKCQEKLIFLFEKFIIPLNSKETLDLSRMKFFYIPGMWKSLSLSYHSSNIIIKWKKYITYKLDDLDTFYDIFIKYKNVEIKNVEKE